MRILAIETSCDETAIAIADFQKSKVKVLADLVSSQVKLHAKFGGVVPNLARREHQRNLPPVLLKALKEGKFPNSKSKILTSKQSLKSKIQKIKKILEREPELLSRFMKSVVNIPSPKIDAIAVTYGPGLAPALWVGVNFAKALAVLWNKPLIPVNHMAGHFYSSLLKPDRHSERSEESLRSFGQSPQDDNVYGIEDLKFPVISLLVSGGHTELVLMKKPGQFKIIGETLDDAAGEAFDKVARILGLKYPGGPEISRLAEKFRIKNHESRIKVTLPRPMINSGDFNFSFSGLKTAVFYLVRDLPKKDLRRLRPEIAKEFQDAVLDVLIKKTVDTAKKYKVKTVLLGGGVAANKLLRKRLSEEIKPFARLAGASAKRAICYLPSASLTGDNALMIALAAFLSGKKKAPTRVRADDNLRLA